MLTRYALRRVIRSPAAGRFIRPNSIGNVVPSRIAFMRTERRGLAQCREYTQWSGCVITLLGRRAVTG